MPKSDNKLRLECFVNLTWREALISLHHHHHDQKKNKLINQNIPLVYKTNKTFFFSTF